MDDLYTLEVFARSMLDPVPKRKVGNKEPIQNRHKQFKHNNKYTDGSVMVKGSGMDLGDENLKLLMPGIKVFVILWFAEGAAKRDKFTTPQILAL